MSSDSVARAQPSRLLAVALAVVGLFVWAPFIVGAIWGRWKAVAWVSVSLFALFMGLGLLDAFGSPLGWLPGIDAYAGLLAAAYGAFGTSLGVLARRLWDRPASSARDDRQLRQSRRPPDVEQRDASSLPVRSGPQPSRRRWIAYSTLVVAAVIVAQALTPDRGGNGGKVSSSAKSAETQHAITTQSGADRVVTNPPLISRSIAQAAAQSEAERFLAHAGANDSQLHVSCDLGPGTELAAEWPCSVFPCSGWIGVTARASGDHTAIKYVTVKC